MFKWFSRKDAHLTEPAIAAAPARILTRSIGKEESLPSPGADDVAESSALKTFAGIRFHPTELETTMSLSKIVFRDIINEKAAIGPHLFSRVAVALVNAGGKTVILFVDKSKVVHDDVAAIVDLLKVRGYELPASGPQGYFAGSSLVLALSQGHLNAHALAVERDIQRDPGKNSLMSSFTDIVVWAYLNKADDIDFAVDLTSPKSQIAFKIGGRYIRPERYLLPTDTVLQMLGIAWQKSAGGAAAQFEVKTEQQANITLDLPPGPRLLKGARVRLRWSGLAYDKGTVVTMRIQRLGDSALIKSLEDGGHVDYHMHILRRLLSGEGGMVVWAGVVGSGKSTSLAQLISMLSEYIKIISFEDPVELEIARVYQKTLIRDLLATGPDPGFLAAIRSLFRSALDALYLGEIRDRETGLIAWQVAESGHSVYTTTHARSALGIIDRFVSPAIGIPRDVLASPDILKLLVYQALLPTTCPHCGKSPDEYARHFDLAGAQLNEHKEYFARIERLYRLDTEKFRLRDPQGCSHCRKEDLSELNGFMNRTVVAEMVETDDQMLEYILAGRNLELFKYWRSLASPRFDDPNLAGKTAMECAIFKASQGIIDPREIEPHFTSFATVEAKRHQARPGGTVA